MVRMIYLYFIWYNLSKNFIDDGSCDEPGYENMYSSFFQTIVLVRLKLEVTVECKESLSLANISGWKEVNYN